MTYLGITLLACTWIGFVSGFMGSFMLARKSALISDMLSHSVFPGICLGFFLAGFDKYSIWLLIGGVIAAQCASLLFELISDRLSVKSDAALAVLLSGFYALGIFLMSLFSKLSAAPRISLDSYLLGQAAAISEQDLKYMLAIGLACLLFVFLFKKEFTVSLFDPLFASVHNLRPKLFRTFLTMLVSSTVMITLQSSGVVLASALLLIPAASAQLLSRHLHKQIFISALIGGTCSLLGSYLSAQNPLFPTGASICIVSFVVFIILLAGHKLRRVS